jgi:hypothetical protein
MVPDPQNAAVSFDMQIRLREKIPSVNVTKVTAEADFRPPGAA